MSIGLTKDQLTEAQATYADNWAVAMVGKYEADMRRGRRKDDIGYYFHDLVRRILSDQQINDPFHKDIDSIRAHRKGWNEAMQYIKEECEDLHKDL